MFKSIIQINTNRCVICGSNKDLEWHHIMNGAFKKKSEQYGGMVRVCKFHHTAGGKECIHDNPSLKTDFKKNFQMNFECDYSHDLWMKEFKKNYL